MPFTTASPKRPPPPTCLAADTKITTSLEAGLTDVPKTPAESTEPEVTVVGTPRQEGLIAIVPTHGERSINRTLESATSVGFPSVGADKHDELRLQWLQVPPSVRPASAAAGRIRPRPRFETSRTMS